MGGYFTEVVQTFSKISENLGRFLWADGEAELCSNSWINQCCCLFTATLGPNSLIFSFSSGASPAHNAGGWVLPLFSQQIFLTKEVDKLDGKMIVAHYPPL